MCSEHSPGTSQVRWNNRYVSECTAPAHSKTSYGPNRGEESLRFLVQFISCFQCVSRRTLKHITVNHSLKVQRLTQIFFYAKHYMLSLFYQVSVVSGKKNFFSHPLFFSTGTVQVLLRNNSPVCGFLQRLRKLQVIEKSSSNFHFTINVWNVQVHFYELNSNFTSNWLLSDMTSRRCIYNSTFKPKVSARACCFLLDKT